MGCLACGGTIDTRVDMNDVSTYCDVNSHRHPQSGCTGQKALAVVGKSCFKQGISHGFTKALIILGGFAYGLIKKFTCFPGRPELPFTKN